MPVMTTSTPQWSYNKENLSKTVCSNWRLCCYNKPGLPPGHWAWLFHPRLYQKHWRLLQKKQQISLHLALRLHFGGSLMEIWLSCKTITIKQQNTLTEHALQPHETADVTVKVDFEMFVRVAHGYDSIKLVVEVESFMRKRQPRGQVRSRQHETTRIWSNVNTTNQWMILLNNVVLSCCSPASLTAFLISKLLMEQTVSLA